MSMIMTTDIRNILESPLVIWVQTFNSRSQMDYETLVDGNYIHEIMCHVDPRCKADDIHQVVEDSTERLLNWEVVLKNIKSYYEDVLQQLLIMSLPNVMIISRSPDSDLSHEEIKKFLLLVLGCAVQCERKGEFIDNIKQLDIETQAVIVEYIKEITDDKKNICTLDISSDGITDDTKNLYNQLRSVLRERDIYIEEIKDLTRSLDNCQDQLEAAQKATGNISNMTIQTTSPKTQEKHHLGVELADCKAKIRRLRQEIEDKNEVTQELRDEIQDLNITLTKLRNENLALSQDARSARAYRDEIDALKEKATKAEKHESEINRYKEKLNELEFYKSRVEELRADNLIVCETKAMLEDQLNSCHKRIDSVVELENELMKYKQQVEEISEERDKDREHIQTLLSENARLHLEVKGRLDESSTLEQELQSSIKDNESGASGSLSEQLNETVNTKLLRLELENQRLQKKLLDKQEMNYSHGLEVEKENRRLAKKIGKYQETQAKESEEILRLETEQHELLQEREQLFQTVETVKESASRQVRELEVENQYLNQTLQTIRERNEKTNDIRLQDLECENKRMNDIVKDLSNQLTTLDFDHRKLQKSYEKLRENVAKMSKLEQEKETLEKQNSDLSRNVQRLKLNCDELENIDQKMSDLEVENQKLVNNVVSLKSVIAKLEIFEQECIALTMENQKLQRSCDNMKKSSTRVIELENEKDTLNTEIKQLTKTIQNQETEKHKYEQIEIDTLDVDNENHKLLKSMELFKKRFEQLQVDNDEMETENEKLHKSLETLKLSLRKLDDLEKTNSDLEADNNKLQKQITSLDRETKKLRQTLEVKESSLDEISKKSAQIEREYLDLKRKEHHKKDLSSRVKELENENKGTLQQLTIDKKTVSTLREDLISEKVKCQQLNNELEKLTYELEKIGLKKEILLATEGETEGESRMKALESMMEDVLKQSLATRDEKIQILELRLEETKLRNVKLQDEVASSRDQMEIFRLEMGDNLSPDTSMDSIQSTSIISNNSSPEHACKQGRVKTSVNFTPTRNTPSEFMMIREHLVDLERTNAALTTENKIIKTTSQSLEARYQNLESKNNQLQNNISEIQMFSNNLQSQVARLQVENTTLDSQNNTLHSQTEALRTLEREHESLISRHDELQNAHESLVSDHEILQQLHEQLSVEYETLISDHGNLKSVHKSLKQDFKELNQKYQTLLRERNSVESMKESLEQDKEKLRTEAKSLGTLQEDFMNTREELARVKSGYNQVNIEYTNLFKEYKNVKTLYNTLQLKHTELQGDMADCRDQLNTMDVEVSKMANKCEALQTINQQLGEENQNLMRQLQALLTQNHDLITQTLESKEQFYEEERSFLEKMSDLRRQKEKLEEKIMEQYKHYEPPKKRSFGAQLVRKAKGFIAKKHRSSSKLDLTSSPDHSICDTGNESFSSSETTIRKMSDPNFQSTHDLTSSSPKLSKQNKKLSSSTTAVNLLSRKESTDGGFSLALALRGSKSTEDLLDPRPKKKFQRTPRKDEKANQKQVSTEPSVVPKKLVPGSMSIYDRSPNTSPRNSTASLISMMEFLDNMSSRSPASRRKMLKDEENKKEKEEPLNSVTPSKPDIVALPDRVSLASNSPSRRQLPNVPDPRRSSPSESLRSQLSNESSSPPKPRPDLLADRRHSSYAPPGDNSPQKTGGRRFSTLPTAPYRQPSDISFTNGPGVTSTPMPRQAQPPIIMGRSRQRPASARLVREPITPTEKNTPDNSDNASYTAYTHGGAGDQLDNNNSYNRRALSPPPLPHRLNHPHRPVTAAGDQYETVDRRQLPPRPASSKPIISSQASTTDNHPPVPPPRKRLGSNPNLLDDSAATQSHNPPIIRQVTRPATAHVSQRPHSAYPSRTNIVVHPTQENNHRELPTSPDPTIKPEQSDNTAATSNEGDSENKPKKNSVWYEYGCV